MQRTYRLALAFAFGAATLLGPATGFSEAATPGSSAPPGASEFLSVFAAEVSEFGTPLVPGMSSIALKFPLRFLPGSASDFVFVLDYWYLSGTYYFHFDPFVEMGFQLSYVDHRRGSSYLTASAGVAVEFFDLTLSLPIVAGAAWHHALGRTGIWAGVDGQVFIWPDGIGVELAIPLDYYPRARVYGSIAPQAIAYFVDDLIHFNFRTALTIGIRGRGRP